MKKVIIIFLITITPHIAFSQEWMWSNSMECAGNVTPMDVITDNSGNIYLTGIYNGSSFTIGSNTITNSGGDDCFIAKFNSDGELQWLKAIGGSLDDETVSIIIVGTTIYVAGNFKSNPVFFTPTFSLANEDNYDAFFASYDLNGNFINAIRIFSGQNVERIKDMFYNSLVSNLCIIAQFKTEIKYTDGSGPVTIPARSNKDLIIVKSDLSGIVQDTVIYSTSVQNSILKDINRSNDNGYYLSGDLFGTVFFDDVNSITGNSTATADVLLVKVNQGLEFQWARKGGGTGYDHGNNAISDIYGNVYITGKVESNVTFDSTGTTQSQIIPGIGAQDLYLAKYNKLGTLQWVKRKGDIGNDNGYGLIQRENLVQFCGNFSGQVIFNDDTLQSSGTTDMNTGFAIFDTKGNEVGAQSIGGAGEDIGSTIAFDIDANTVISGYSASDTLYIGDSSFINTSGTYNGFIASYNYPMKTVFTTIENIDCNGANTARLIATPFFGIGPYTYSWSPNVTSSNDSLAYNLASDTYSVTITDSRLITASNTIVLSEPDEISILADVSDVSCHPENGISNNGTIDLTVSGGTVSGLYDYTWEAITGSGINATSEDQFTLTMGQYSITVTDDNLCEAYDTFLVNQPDPIIFAGSFVIPASGGGNNGEIDLTVSGGNDGLPYEFIWSNDSTTEDITNLFGGNYTVTVTDILSCVEDTTFLVQDLSLFQAYISNKEDVDCHGNSTGSAIVAISGGTGPYTYNWENEFGVTISITNQITNVQTGWYYVTVTETPDTAYTQVFIDEPDEDLFATHVRTHVLCKSDNSGIIDLTVIGGTLPYSFLWSNSATTEDLINLYAGDYWVSVTDDNGCTVLDAGIEITEPSDGLDINITVDQPIFCNGDLTGVLTATATGGTGTKEYIWNDPANQTTQTATGLEAGTYGVTATDQNGCSVSDEYDLTEPDPLILSETHQDISCFGNSDGIIDLSVSGGNGGNNYSWSNGQITQDISGLDTGTYYVTVTDANNCTADTSIIIYEPDAISFQDIQLTDASCFDYSDGAITITAQGGVGNFRYSIDGGTTYSTNATFTDVSAGTYTLRILDGNDCESADSIVVINQPEGTTMISAEATEVSCFASADGSIIISATSPVGGLTYSIDDGISYLENDGLFTDLAPGTYNIWIQDANGCEQEFPSVDVGQPEMIAIDTNVTHATGDQLGEIEIISSGGTPPYSYVLHSTSIDTSNSNGIFPGLAPDDYSVHVLDDRSCSSDTLGVSILQTSTGLIIYDAFSPNDDGLNEVWNIGNIGMYPDCKVTIFNTWGNMVYSSDGYSEPWDGTWNGKELPAGTYYFIIDPGDGSDPLSGPVSIVR